MSTALWMRILAFASAATVIVVVACIFPFRFFTDGYLVASAIVLALSILSFFFGPRRATDAHSQAGWLGALGVRAVFLFVALIASIVGVLLSGFGVSLLSVAFDVVAILGLLFSLGLAIVTANQVEAASRQTDFPSDHLVWRNELLRLAELAKASESGTSLSALAEKSRYLGRDLSPSKSGINSKIDSSIASLEAAYLAGDVQQVRNQIQVIEALMNEREKALKTARSKA